jgi:DNA-binding NtrC family response regulator
MQGTILIIDDEAAQREALAGHVRAQGFDVLEAANGRAGIDCLRGHLVDLIITDYRMPELDGLGVLREAHDINPAVEVIIVTAYGTIAGAVDALQGGACHYLEKPIDLDELDALVDGALLRRQQGTETESLRRDLQASPQLQGLVSADPAMQEALNVVARVAPSRASVVIIGESGTGKELVARALHEASPRREKPFVAVNCASLNENVIESELFGHEKGAFTGAVQMSRGRFEQADGGTLFLDELAEIPAPVQVKLLRVLQERTIERVGGTAPIPVDVRLLSATHADLAATVAAGIFREDLLYRLNVVTIHLPPLRQRRGDIPALVETFLARYAEENGRSIQGISRDALDLLLRQPWPGNVRELQNVIERAVVMSRGDVLDRADLPPEIIEAGAESPADIDGGEAALPDRVQRLEREAIREALDASGGNQSQAAARLGITERNLRYKLDKYGMR